jgi:hypothetical protein
MFLVPFPQIKKYENNILELFDEIKNNLNYYKINVIDEKDQIYNIFIDEKNFENFKKEI